jgi:hypothetical protein
MKIRPLSVLAAAPVALAAALVVAASAFAASAFAVSPQPRDSVPDNELKLFRTVASQFKDAGADPRYVPITDLAGISCIADPAGSGAMGIHYLDPSNLMDGMLDPNAPEAIVYAPSPNGSLRLAALEYIVDQAAWDAKHPSAPEFIKGHPFMLMGAPNRFGLAPFYSQHIWVGMGNPSGNLNMWNPAVHCPS